MRIARIAAGVLTLWAALGYGCASWTGGERPVGSYRAGTGGLDFGYRISGVNARWKPTTVYNDGVKTIIEMPPTLSQGEAPTLLAVRPGGGWFSAEDLVLVNYRVQRNRYIVDTLFDKAVLLAGVGSRQERVTIERSR